MNIVCAYCGKEFDSTRKKKYCSAECRKEQNKANMRKSYIWKSDRKIRCMMCGKETPPRRIRFCSRECSIKWNRIKKGLTQTYEETERVCVACGETFLEYKQNRITCSVECAKVYRDKLRKTYDPERSRKEYLRINPHARTRADIVREAEEKREKKRVETQARKEQREAELKANREQREAEKKANIKHWLEYEAVHECEVCGKPYIAHYPLSKYCSTKCKRKKHKHRARYDGITVDKDITLQKLARRDGDQCMLCGLFVDWNDYEVTDDVVVCGNMYPSIDHITPISFGGVHSWDNVQLAHRICNSRKSNKFVG